MLDTGNQASSTDDTPASLDRLGHTDLTWRPAALAAADRRLVRMLWDQERGVMVLPAGRDWEPAVEFRDLLDLREHLFCVAHDAWALLVPWDDDGPVEEPLVREIVEDALAAYLDKVAAMGWAAERTTSSPMSSRLEEEARG